MRLPRPATRGHIALLSLIVVGLAAACGPQVPIDLEGASQGQATPPLGQPLSRGDVPITSRIVNGTADQSFNSVGLITMARPTNTRQVNVCTGTVVARRIVLTAAHCLLAVDDNGAEQAAPARPSAITFHLGASLPTLRASTSDHDYAGVAIYLPGGTQNFPYATFVRNLNGLTVNNNDLGLLEVDHDLDAPSLSVVTAPMTSDAAGAVIQVPGYGSTGTYGAPVDGQRRVAQLAVSNWNDSVFQALSNDGSGANICSGDSGAPAVFNNVVQGVTSSVRTVNNVCLGKSTYIRLDVWKDFLFP